ncbi:hypothetical protein KIN20_023381 [Parelaphostrongylus tenuis]|uniref:Nanos-type domain-containing protein n=1 Tax=Parelaphostrongylus tenuis TaxID=148309 RepID=A0AAD5MRX6_PARTN|nr:hypothetical protein KIN20_023381 [Parelaphostrongylus tenuis]
MLLSGRMRRADDQNVLHELDDCHQNSTEECRRKAEEKNPSAILENSSHNRPHQASPRLTDTCNQTPAATRRRPRGVRSVPITAQIVVNVLTHGGHRLISLRSRRRDRAAISGVAMHDIMDNLIGAAPSATHLGETDFPLLGIGELREEFAAICTGQHVAQPTPWNIHDWPTYSPRVIRRYQYWRRIVKTSRRRPMCSFCYNRYVSMCIDKNRPIPSIHNSGIWREHNSKQRGIVTCPHLWAYKCTYCGATKEFAHTEDYCPSRIRYHHNNFLTFYN